MSNAAMTAVFRHSASTQGARLVLLAMADEANSEGELTAYRRSYSALATKCNMDRSSIRRALVRLVELGEVVVLRQGDGRTSSDYRIVLPGLGDTPDEGRQNAHPGRGTTPTQGRRNAHPGGTERLPHHPLPSPSSPRETPSPPTPQAPSTPAQPSLLPPVTDLPVGRTYEPATGDLAFDEFWRTYPRREAKTAARKAWHKAIRQAPDHVIVAGAARYRDDPNRDPEYTAHPASWLNAGRWDDEPLPARSNGATKVQQSVARLATTSGQQGSAVDVAAHGLAERRRTAFTPTRPTRELPS